MDSGLVMELGVVMESGVVMELGIHPSLHYHQKTYAKFNLKIHYPPPFERKIWHYQKANAGQIRKAVDQFS